MANSRHPDDSAPLDFDLDLDEFIPTNADNPSPPGMEGGPPSAPANTANRPSRSEDLDELQDPEDQQVAPEESGASPPPDFAGKEYPAFPRETPEVVFDDDEEEGYLDEVSDGEVQPPDEPQESVAPPALPELPELDAIPTPMAMKPRGNFSPSSAAGRATDPLPDLEDLEDLDRPETAPPAPPPPAVSGSARDTAADEPAPSAPASAQLSEAETPDALVDLDGLDGLDGLEFQAEGPVSVASGPEATAVSRAATEGVPDDLGHSDAEGATGGRHPSAKKLVPLEWASLGLVAALVLIGLFLFQRSVRREPSAHGPEKPSATVPDQIEGRLFKLEGVKAYWRERRDTDRADRASILLPELSVEVVAGASGYLQALFQDETGALRGDSVTHRATNGTFETGGAEAKFLGTEGFINESFFAGYQMEGADAAWSITLRESADNSEWTELATFRIPAVRENP